MRRFEATTALLLLLGALAALGGAGCCCCEKQEPAVGFDYFRAKAEELGRDRARVVAFVRDDVATLPYRGDVKGPLGALWGGAASPEEKVALAAALIVHCAQKTPATIDEVAPRRAREEDAGARALSFSIVHRVLLEGGGERETRVFEGPIGALVGEVHSIELAGGRTRFSLRGAPAVAKEIDAAGAVGEEVVLTVEAPGRAEPLVETRELWRRGNRAGAASRGEGDRHDFVVLPCRTTSYVREKEALLLRERRRDAGPDAAAYLALLEYALESDRALGELEKALGVTAEFEVPRVLILSRFVGGGPSGAPWQALDQRLDRTAFAGDAERAALAALARSLLESALSARFLEERSMQAAASASELFAGLREDLASTRARRIGAIQAALEKLGACGEGAKATFRARGAGNGGGQAPAVVSRADDRRLRATGPTGLDAVFATSAEAARAVEGALARGGGLASAALDIEIDRGLEPLVVPGGRFLFRWSAAGRQVEERISVLSAGDGLAYRWRVKAGAWPASGTRAVGPRAVAEATVHNPWYEGGPSAQEDVSSFVVSRRVLRALRGGAPCDFAIRERRTAEADGQSAHPLEHHALEPAGRGDARPLVNGREETIATIRARWGEETLAILDDPAFPVGMADAIVEVATSVRGRVVDESGRGIADAEVSIGGLAEPVTTWPDGSFRLPPPPPEGYGLVKARIALRGREIGTADVDLRSPGRAEVLLHAVRPHAALVWIGRANRAKLDALPLSEQAKRNAARDIDRGRVVAIPDLAIDGIDGSPTVAYYAVDESGTAIGTEEDGIRGASAAAPSGPGATRGGGAGGSDAWWLRTPFRKGGLLHGEIMAAIAGELAAWQEGPAAPDPAGEAPRARLGAALEGRALRMDVGAARTGFQSGYVAATRFLAHEPPEGP
jgi:hypothetical protein